MIFKYFKGPIDEMSDLVIEHSVCSICGKTDHCFELDYTITNVFSDDEKDGKFGCYSCLKEGKFEFWHDTEFGMLDENGLSKVYKHNMDNPPFIDIEKLVELRRTPQIITWQQELWLTHCDDFMIYKGTWEPKDFYSNSKDGNGKALFMSMTDKELNHLWDDSLPENETLLKEWYPTYYVFACSHCGNGHKSEFTQIMRQRPYDEVSGKKLIFIDLKYWISFRIALDDEDITAMLPEQKILFKSIYENLLRLIEGGTVACVLSDSILIEVEKMPLEKRFKTAKIMDKLCVTVVLNGLNGSCSWSPTVSCCPCQIC